MAKEVAGLIKLQIKGAAANPAPPVGPALGAKGVNIMVAPKSKYFFFDPAGYAQSLALAFYFFRCSILSRHSIKYLSLPSTAPVEPCTASWID